MTLDELDILVRFVDRAAVQTGPMWRLNIQDRDVRIVTDPGADRMRIMIPLGPSDPEQLQTLMDANFGATQDARWATRDGTVYAVFTHGWAQLSEDTFFQGLGNVVSMAHTYGRTNAAGTIDFGR